MIYYIIKEFYKNNYNYFFKIIFLMTYLVNDVILIDKRLKIMYHKKLLEINFVIFLVDVVNR